MRGLSQAVSAEAMGDGRLTVGMTATWYGQKANAPLQDANVLTGTMALSYGLNPWLDIFGSATGYGMMADPNQFGQGSLSAGLRGSLMLPKLSPLLLGVQLGVISGTSTCKLNNNNFNGYERSNTDGYDYFETDLYYDCVVKFIESLIFGNDSFGIKIHFNQGAALGLEKSNQQLLLIGGGIQGSVNPKIVLGLELNSRTNIQDPHNQTDPFWLTPSVLYRTPYSFNALLGADISVSKERDWVGNRALEPFRLFGGLAFSFDLLEKQRRAEREKVLAEKTAMDKKVREAQARSAMLARKAKADSSAIAKARETQKRRVDSMAQKSREDSIKIADMTKKLAEERSKRPDMEKQLLSTGLLIMDAIYFETGKAQISINSFPYLNIIGKMLANYPKLQIEVSGHTDNVGNYDRNITLSQARAEAVRRYFIQVAPDLLTRISARGYGPTQPKATNTTKEGRKMNRRTELQVLNKEVLKEYN